MASIDPAPALDPNAAAAARAPTAPCRNAMPRANSFCSAMRRLEPTDAHTLRMAVGRPLAPHDLPQPLEGPRIGGAVRSGAGPRHRLGRARLPSLVRAWKEQEQPVRRRHRHRRSLTHTHTNAHAPPPPIPTQAAAPGGRNGRVNHRSDSPRIHPPIPRCCAVYIPTHARPSPLVRRRRRTSKQASRDSKQAASHKCRSSSPSGRGISGARASPLPGAWLDCVALCSWHWGGL